LNPASLLAWQGCLGQSHNKLNDLKKDFVCREAISRGAGFPKGDVLTKAAHHVA
jgi:hypothetical protein